MKPLFEEILIAPCGMNCGLCLHYLRAENKCPGCYTGRKVNGKLIKCRRRLCKERKGDFCYECGKFPCDSLKRLDKRYRERYSMSEIENLEYIKEHGLKKFLAKEQKKWQCPKCGGVICCHNDLCFHCQLKELKRKKKKYRWED